MFKKRESGLTLIELIIVLVIISILVLIVIAFFRNQISKANDAKRKADLERIQVAIEEYDKDHGCYPSPLLLNCIPGTGLQPYLDKIPCDPVSKASYYYDYDTNTCAGWYRLYTNLSGGGVSYGPDNAFNYTAGSPNAPSPELIQSGNLYGCKGGFCVKVLWNSQRPGPECDPTFKSSSCYGQCGVPSAQCQTWTP